MEEHTADYLRGVAAALRDDLDAAIVEFESAVEAEPSSLPALLGLLDALVRSGRIDEADAVAAQLLARNPPESAALAAVARLRERQARSVDAADLLSRADLGHDLAAYALYLRVLIEEGRFEEAILEAERGLDWDLARPQALLTKGLSLLHFGDLAGAANTLDEVDSVSFDALLSDWASGLGMAKKTDDALRLLDPVLRGPPRSETAAVLARKLTDAK
jgi:tetratricopeptide (TPR) repeat protein